MVVIKPHGAQRVPFTAAGGDEHFHPPVASQLHRRHAHATRPGMDQQRFPGANRGQIGQPEQGRQEHHRHGGGFGRCPALRRPGNQFLMHHGQRTRAAQESHDRVTDGHTGDLRTDLDHHPGTFGTQRGGLAGIHPQCGHHVAEVDPYG